MNSPAPASNYVCVALGSNLGDSRSTVRAAMTRLRELAAGDFRESSLWRSTPVDCPPDSPPFVNAVVIFQPRPDETPESLLAKLQTIEREFGRGAKKIMNEPRPLDLDIIAFGAEIRATTDLTLPHPRAHQRRFVLQPLAEIAPNLVLPGQSRTVAELLAALTTEEQLIRLAFPT